jgi:hypothetical protein
VSIPKAAAVIESDLLERVFIEVLSLFSIVCFHRFSGEEQLVVRSDEVEPENCPDSRSTASDPVKIHGDGGTATEPALRLSARHRSLGQLQFVPEAEMRPRPIAPAAESTLRANNPRNRNVQTTEYYDCAWRPGSRRCAFGPFFRASPGEEQPCTLSV